LSTLNFWLILVAGLVAATAAVRYTIARRVEREDARRPRDADGVLVGAAGFTLEREGAPGVLLLHGGGDTPQTLRELGEYLHQRGFAVTAPLLPGHGRTVREFQRVSFGEYRRTAEEAYDRLGAGRPWMGVVGLSMGGALAAVTVADRPATSALVLLAPYVELPGTLRLAAAVSWLAELFSPYFSAQDPRSVRDPAAAARGLAYGVFTPGALRALKRTAGAGAAALARIRTPTLIVQSRQDNRVAPAVAARALAALRADDKRLEWVSEGGHVITVDYGKARVFALTGDWLASHGAESLLRS
jgi:carboxylesterase